MNVATITGTTRIPGMPDQMFYPLYITHQQKPIQRNHNEQSPDLLVEKILIYIQQKYIIPILKSKNQQECLVQFKNSIFPFATDKLRIVFQFLQTYPQKLKQLGTANFWKNIFDTIEQTYPQLFIKEEILESVYIYLAAQKAFGEAISRETQELFQKQLFCQSSNFSKILEELAETEIISELALLLLIDIPSIQTTQENTSIIENIFVMYSYQYHQRVVQFLDSLTNQEKNFDKEKENFVSANICDDPADSDDPAIRLCAALKEVVLASKGQKKLVDIRDFLNERDKSSD